MKEYSGNNGQSSNDAHIDEHLQERQAKCPRREREKREREKRRIKRASNDDSDTLSLAETLTDHEPLPFELLSNQAALRDLSERIEDWKGYDVATFGELLLHGELKIVSSTQSNRAKKYQCYLFQHIFICCKAKANPAQTQKSVLSSASTKPEPISRRLTLQPTTQPAPTFPGTAPNKPSFRSQLCCFSSSTSSDPHDPEVHLEKARPVPADRVASPRTDSSGAGAPLRLKGRVFVRDITNVITYGESDTPHGRKLRVEWRRQNGSDEEEEFFVIRFPNTGNGMFERWVEELERLVGGTRAGTSMNEMVWAWACGGIVTGQGAAVGPVVDLNGEDERREVHGWV